MQNKQFNKKLIKKLKVKRSDKRYEKFLEKKYYDGFKWTTFPDSAIRKWHKGLANE